MSCLFFGVVDDFPVEKPALQNSTGRASADKEIHNMAPLIPSAVKKYLITVPPVHCKRSLCLLGAFERLCRLGYA